MTRPAKSAPRRPPPPTITDLEDFEESINMCIYGDPGAGKTPLAATLPNAIMIATEQGSISAKRYLKGKSDTKLIRAFNFTEFRRATLWLRDVAVPAGTYEWLIIDSANRMQDMLLRDILDRMKAENPHRDADIPDKGEHQKWQVQFKKYVNMINDLPINVLWTAHAMRDFDEEGEPLVLPMFQGKNGTDDSKTMSMWFSGGVSLLGYLGINEDEISEPPFRRLVIKRSGPYVAKDRFDLGVEWIDNPDLADIYKRIKNSGADEPEATKPRARAQRRGQ